MSFYIGVDFHPHQQTVTWFEIVTGELKTVTLRHQLDEVKAFYAALPPATVGLEAGSRADWFETLLQTTGHTLLVGDPQKIRARAQSRHKSDKRDSLHIWELLQRNEFPALWRRNADSQQVLDLLLLRHNLVRQRTQTYNRLQAFAHNCGLPRGKCSNQVMQKALLACAVNAAQAVIRTQLFALLKQLNEQIKELETTLDLRAKAEPAVQRLLTQAGVGNLTALAVVHTLGDVKRFSQLSKQVVAYVGLDPVEQSSGSKTKFGGISKHGSRLLRFLLGQAVQSASRYDRELKGFYQRLKKKKHKAVAKTAASRKLLVKLAIMLRDEISAAEFDERGRTVGNARESQGQP